MTVSRKVFGYSTDSNRPGWKKDAEFDLDATGGGSIGSVPLSNRAYVVATEQGGPILKKTTFTITSAPVTTVDATTNGAHGSLQLYDFPVGLIHILGATMSLSTSAGAGGLSDTAAIIQSVGSVTVSNSNATLTSTEADIIPSTAGTLSGGVNTAVVGVSTATAVLDGHTTAADAFLNFVSPDAGSSGDDILTVSGTVTIFWHYLGDV